jgi:hypothetical protein
LIENSTTCAESDLIAPQRSSESFRVLKCHIDKDKSLLHECIRDSMLAELEKRAPELGRNARFVTKVPFFFFFFFFFFALYLDNHHGFVQSVEHFSSAALPDRAIRAFLLEAPRRRLGRCQNENSEEGGVPASARHV